MTVSRIAAALAAPLLLALPVAGPALAEDPVPSARDYPVPPAGWQVPRTAWGDQDLRGVWPVDYLVGTPRERPADLGQLFSELPEKERHAAFSLLAERQQRPSALRLRIEHPLESGDDVSCPEGSAVVELYACSEVKGVSHPVSGNVPRARETGYHLRVGSEAHEAVEDVADGSAGGNIGGERGVERARVVCVARVDQRVARSR